MKPEKLKTKRGRISRYQKNIRIVFDKATPKEITSGIYWYEEAGKTASLISEAYEITKETACLVIAALSPNNNWMRNISDAWKVAKCWHRTKDYANETQRNFERERLTTCTYSANKRKAFDILDGRLSVLNGLKTANFARNLNGCEDSVTVDVHAFSIANSKRITAKEMTGIRPNDYAEIAEAYRLLAQSISIAPAHLQAIVWQTWRRIHKLNTFEKQSERLF